MGAPLFSRFADWTAEADAILGYSIRELCVDDPRGELALTGFTQPALYVVNALTYRARREDGKPAPDFAAGHSLGEYNALQAAGAFDFATGLRMVQRRGQLMGRVHGGGMAAVIGLEPAAIEATLAATEAGRKVDVANFNSFEQTVIAGPKEDLAAVQATLVDAGARAVMPLNVSAPFHSRYMRGAQEQFTAFLAGFDFRMPAFPVIANATGEPYDAAGVRDTLARQIGSSVRWLNSMTWLLGHGVTEFEEVGPGKVLGKLIAQIQKRKGQAD
jgi:trans-AT polyketide synthase/acyltransferase/oxidoreductase domain-containing protein